MEYGASCVDLDHQDYILLNHLYGLMNLTVIGAVIGLFIMVLLAPTLEYEIRLRRRAKADYLKARGTIHRQILQTCLSNLEPKISELEAGTLNLLSRRAALENEVKRELEVALTTHVVDKELDQVPGIGSVLKDRIIQRCFDGTLESLSDSRFVPGIGEQKYVVIREWVESTKPKMAQLLLEDFPGKDNVLKKYADLNSGLEQELKVNDLELQRFRQLRSEATSAINGLESVDASTFLAAYRRNGKAAEVVTRYLVGVFPEWGREPNWFKILVEMNKTA